MTDESVSLTVRGAEYYLRYDQPDMIAAEQDTRTGYVYFFDPKLTSLNLMRVLIWRGLRIRNKKGDLVYAYPQNAEGQIRAGEFIRIYIADGHQPWDLTGVLAKAIVASGWYPPKKMEPEEKNLPADG
jgi:hypothetical protein